MTETTQETTTPFAVEIVAEKHPWIEGQGETFIGYAYLNEAQIADGDAQIAAALAEVGRPGDEALAKDFRIRLASKEDVLHLWFKTPGRFGYGYAPIAQAVAMLVDPQRSPEEQFAQRERIRERTEREQRAEHERNRRLEVERQQRQQEAAFAMEQRLAKWNAVPKFEQACRLLSVYSPEHAAVAEALLIVAAIQDQLPARWDSLPPCDVDLIGKTLEKLKLFSKGDVVEIAREGHTLLKCNAKSGRGLPGNREMTHGQVREVPNTVLADHAVKAWIDVGDLVVVNEAAFVVREVA